MWDYCTQERPFSLPSGDLGLCIPDRVEFEHEESSDGLNLQQGWGKNSGSFPRFDSASPPAGENLPSDSEPSSTAWLRVAWKIAWGPWSARIRAGSLRYGRAALERAPSFPQASRHVPDHFTGGVCGVLPWAALAAVVARLARELVVAALTE